MKNELTLDALPNEILLEIIFYKLNNDLKYHKILILLNKHWSRLLNIPVIWKNLIAKHLSEFQESNTNYRRSYFRVEKIVSNYGEYNNLSAEQKSLLIDVASKNHIDNIYLSNDQSNFNTLLLDTAVQFNRYTMIHLLLSHGLNINSLKKESVSFNNVLHKAALDGHTESLELLMERNANPDLKTRHGLTPLICAAQNGHEETVAALIKFKANVNLATDKNESPLSVASQNGYLPIVKTLLEHKANFSLNDHTNHSLWKAVKKGRARVVEFLINANTPLKIAGKEWELFLEMFYKSKRKLGNNSAILLLSKLIANQEFINKLMVQVERIQSSTYGDTCDRDKKIQALGKLITVVGQNPTQTVAQNIALWKTMGDSYNTILKPRKKETGYKIIDYVQNFFNKKPKSLQLIDAYEGVEVNMTV